MSAARQPRQGLRAPGRGSRRDRSGIWRRPLSTVSGKRSIPCLLIVKHRRCRRERFLTDAEFRRLGRVQDEAENCKGVSVHAVAATRILLLAGCRSGEILKLRWLGADS